MAGMLIPEVACPNVIDPAAQAGLRREKRKPLLERKKIGVGPGFAESPIGKGDPGEVVVRLVG